MSRVCNRSYTTPTTRNNAAETSPWLSIWITAPCTASLVSAKRPIVTNPIWATDE